MLTKLDAVNLILDGIGEEPVSSLNSGLPDAETAERFLDRVSREVQAKGWHCNTDFKYRLIPDENSLIRLPQTILRIDTTYTDKNINVTVRDYLDKKHLYNVKDQTFEFPRAILVNVVWEFLFEDLTYELQNYIAYHAARRFQTSEMSSISLDRLLEEGEAMAWAALMDAETESEDLNILKDSPHARWVAFRYNRTYGR